ncbi:plasmid mobilization protein [Christensenella timonensis]|uniref:plasmid mobilization protein n=1 Tax=Christensenella timonensis TaxID=1816678 RepID=UPI0038B2F698
MLKRRIKAETRLTTNEYLQLKRAARRTGLSMAAYIRKCCLTDERVVVIDRKVIGSIYAELNKIGSNVNQIAHIANSDKKIPAHSIRRIEQYFDEIKRLYDEKLRQL